MKWGVRKRPEPTRVDGSSKTIKKGEIVNRVSRGSNKFNDSGGLYVSRSKEDGARYIKALGPSVMARLLKGAGDRVVHLEASKDIKVSSEKDFIANSAKVFTNKKNLDLLNQSWYSVVYTENYEKNIEPKHISDAIKNPSAPSSRRLGYVMSSMLVDTEMVGISKQIFDSMKKSGFDAIPDLHDTMTGTSSTATIIINKDKVKVVGETAITKETYKEMKRRVKQYSKLPVDPDIEI